MAKKSGSKPRTAPTKGDSASSNPPEEPGDWVRMHLYDEWREATGKPEERVRQDFILHLYNNYGYALQNRWIRSDGPCTVAGVRAPTS